MIAKLFKRYLSPEACLKRHRQFRDAYKIEGCVAPGETTSLEGEHSVSHSTAALYLCIKHSIGDVDRVRVWESSEYKFADDAEGVLKAECRRISELVNKRIEVVGFDDSRNEYVVQEVFNPNNQQYWLEETNL